jgi:hypothetical protein
MPFPLCVTPAEVAAASQALVALPLSGVAQMHSALISKRATFVGQFDRVPESEFPRYRRGTGGVSFETEEGAFYIGIALAHPGSLLAGSANQVLNRMVRPLLKALTKVHGKRVAYFGRDHIRAEQKNVGWVAMAHRVDTDRAAFEAFLPPTERTHDLAEEIASAYTLAHPALVLAPFERANGGAQALAHGDPPWLRTESEAIGSLGLMREHDGRRRIGGTLMASADRMHALNQAIQSPMGVSECGEFLDLLFAAPAMLFGVRSLESICNLVMHTET